MCLLKYSKVVHSHSRCVIVARGSGSSQSVTVSHAPLNNYPNTKFSNLQNRTSLFSCQFFLDLVTKQELRMLRFSPHCCFIDIVAVVVT